MNATQREKRDQDTHDKVVRIEAVLLGANGDDGLVGYVKETAQSHYKLKQHFWILIGLLVGSGLLVGGINLFWR
ncbi:MAG: hypothetical protein KAR06_04790 [Deltaproteobacteria bacterium]|nr:hypothetical protein [Deltaproteobacteria bacterium]